MATPYAKNFSISFWIKGSFTISDFTYGVYMVGTGTNQYAGYYSTVSVVKNTWKYVTLNVPALTDTTIGAITSAYVYVGGLTNSYGYAINAWNINTAPAFANWSTTNWSGIGNTFTVTGVQVEKGSLATVFDFRPLSLEYEMVNTTTAGYVGIGTSTPAYPLDVNGSVRMGPGVNYCLNNATYTSTIGGPLIITSGGWDVAGTSHTINLATYLGTNGADNYSGTLFVQANNKGSSGSVQAGMYFVGKPYGNTLQCLSIGTQITGTQIGTLTFTSVLGNVMTFTTSAALSIAWTFIGAV